MHTLRPGVNVRTAVVHIFLYLLHLNIGACGCIRHVGTSVRIKRAQIPTGIP